MRIEFATTLSQVEPAQWNRLWRNAYPFVRYEFLAALESSGCVSPTTGWQPQHCLLYQDERLIAAMPLYAKSHSYGEYVFDWSWADAYRQHGFAYYPKLINAIPFTPATGPRWGFAEGLTQEQQREAMAAMETAVAQLMERAGFSSFHSLFSDAVQTAQWLDERRGNTTPLALHRRLDCQFHWINRGFACFDDFLATFNSRKRKNLNKERRKVAEQGIIVTMREGAELDAQNWQQFYQLYQRTYIKRSGHTGYLNESFFQQIGTALADGVVMAQAHRGTEMVAAALYLRDQSTLYGRYWGALEEFDGLHFECCYYQGIEYAIANKIERFDPGAQGEHKIARGFTPVLTQSLHHIAHPDFARAIADFLEREQLHVAEYCQQARAELPFKEGTAVVSERHLIDPSPG